MQKPTQTLTNETVQTGLPVQVCSDTVHAGCTGTITGWTGPNHWGFSRAVAVVIDQYGHEPIWMKPHELTPLNGKETS